MTQTTIHMTAQEQYPQSQSLDAIKDDMKQYLDAKAQQTEIIKHQQFLNSLPYKED
jgi:hypothetical protein